MNSPAAPAPPQASREGEAYLDIVWKQFCKNRLARAALWVLGPVFLLSLAAPLLASNIPFAFTDGEIWLFPWFRWLFNPEEKIDYFFNMGLAALLPAALAATILNGVLRRRGAPGRIRVLAAAAVYLALTAILSAVFLIPGVRPNNRYWGRDFVREQFEHPDTHRGWYAPIPFGPGEVDPPSRMMGPGHRKPASRRQDVNDGVMHLLGTDGAGRDVAARMLFGTRVAMSVGFVAVSLYISIGIVLGALAGYFGGWTDILISRAIEVMLLFPSFFLILTLVGLIGPSIYIVMVVIGITGWPTVARLIRGEVLKQRAQDYTLAARALGVSHLRVLFRHVLPNSLAPALVSAPFGVANAIITEAALSLLGFGMSASAPSWGSLLNEGSRNYDKWWLIVFPSLGIFCTVTLFNLVGSGLRDAMDPRLRS